MNVVTTKVKRLSVRLALQFGQLKARKKELEKEEKKIVPLIKPFMTDTDEDVQHAKSVSATTGETVHTYTYAPEGSPFLIEYTTYQATDVSWKDEFEKLYIQTFGEKAFLKFLAKLPLKDCDKLESKPNPNYRPELHDKEVS
jgi:hypothetical protein